MEYIRYGIICSRSQKNEEWTVICEENIIYLTTI